MDWLQKQFICNYWIKLCGFELHFVNLLVSKWSHHWVIFNASTFNSMKTAQSCHWGDMLTSGRLTIDCLEVDQQHQGHLWSSPPWIPTVRHLCWTTANEGRSASVVNDRTAATLLTKKWWNSTAVWRNPTECGSDQVHHPLTFAIVVKLFKAASLNKFTTPPR